MYDGDMSVGSDLQKMGSFLEGFESSLGTVHGVEFVDRIDADRGPTVDVEVAIAPSSDRQRLELSPTEAEIEPDGRLRLALETAEPLVPAGTDDIDVEPIDAAIEPDGTITATVRASVQSGPRATEIGRHGVRASSATDERGSTGTRESASDSDGAGHVDGDGAGHVDGDSTADSGDADTQSDATDRDVPPFRDPELLAEVYESCDTFAEMSEAIEMDVTGETVRRYMIDYGIHEPDSYESADTSESGETTETTTSEAGTRSAELTAGDVENNPALSADADRSEETSSPVVVTDGIGVHENVTVDTLVETIPRANTVYEVQRAIGLDREETRELLEKLDLLDLVVGRIATQNERDIGRETILERIRGAAETTTAAAS